MWRKMLTRPTTSLPSVLLLGLICSTPTLVGPRQSQAQCEYAVTVIRPAECPFFGPPPTFGNGINELGDVAGAHWQCGNSWTDDTAFLWTAEIGMTTLSMPTGTSESSALDVNDAGQVVGWFNIPGDGFSILAFLAERSQLTVIYPPAGTYSQACAISNDGLVAGATGDGTPYFKGFVWQDDVMTLILPTFGPRSLVHDLNEIGQAVGWMGTSATIDSHAFLWEEGVMTDLGLVPGGSTGLGRAINNLGHVLVTGKVEGKSGTLTHSFLWIDGEFSDLGVLPGYDHTFGRAINDFDQVVGICRQAVSPYDETAFIWQDGVMTELNELVADEAIDIFAADAINNAGQIATSGGQDMDGAALLLTPLQSCPGDLDCDGFVGITDFLNLLVAWGSHPAHPADLDGDGTVGIQDFLMLLANWGSCP